MADRQLIADLLSALEYHTEQTRPIEFSKVAIEAAREYLRKPVQQEPVAWVCMKGEEHDIDFDQSEIDAIPVGTFLYITPPQRTWVGLTDEDWGWVADKKETSLDTFAHGAAWAADQLKEKNT